MGRIGEGLKATAMNDLKLLKRWLLQKKTIKHLKNINLLKNISTMFRESLHLGERLLTRTHAKLLATNFVKLALS